MKNIELEGICSHFAAAVFSAIKIAVGSKIKNETIIPLTTEGILKSIEEIIKPTITHIENAEIFASNDNFCIIIGVTSRIPAIVPKTIPINFLLLMFLFPLHRINVFSSFICGGIIVCIVLSLFIFERQKSPSFPET